MLNKYCEQCGKQLTKDQIWNKNKRCSMNCYLDWNRNRIRHTTEHDENFLQQNSAFRAYFLGLFVSDGNFHKKRHCVSITSTDKSIIDYLVEKTMYRKKVYIGKPRNNRVKTSYKISFYGQIAQDMINIVGYLPGPKTGKEFIPKCIDDSVFFHFLRGCIDGDGSILKRKNKNLLVVKLCSANKDFLQSIFNKLKILGIARGGGIHPTSTIYQILFSHEDGVRLCEKLYENAEFGLLRKKEVYLALKDVTLKQYSQKGLVCCIPNCTKNSWVKGYCQHHYYQRPEHVNFKKEYYLKNKSSFLFRRRKYNAIKRLSKEVF